MSAVLAQEPAARCRSAEAAFAVHPSLSEAGVSPPYLRRGTVGEVRAAQELYWWLMNRAENAAPRDHWIEAGILRLGLSIDLAGLPEYPGEPIGLGRATDVVLAEATRELSLAPTFAPCSQGAGKVSPGSRIARCEDRDETPPWSPNQAAVADFDPGCESCYEWWHKNVYDVWFARKAGPVGAVAGILIATVEQHGWPLQDRLKRMFALAWVSRELWYGYAEHTARATCTATRLGYETPFPPSRWWCLEDGSIKWSRDVAALQFGPDAITDDRFITALLEPCVALASQAGSWSPIAQECAMLADRIGGRLAIAIDELIPVPWWLPTGVNSCSGDRGPLGAPAAPIELRGP